MKIENYYPKNWEDFNTYLEEIESKPHDYNTIADALTQATVAFFNYFASKHGMTGFQASWSQLQIIGVLRGLEAPFMIVDSGKQLFPQYDILRDVEEFLENSKPALGKIAKDNLENDTKYASPNVIKRWEELAKHTDE